MGNHLVCQNELQHCNFHKSIQVASNHVHTTYSVILLLHVAGQIVLAADDVNTDQCLVNGQTSNGQGLRNTSGQLRHRQTRSDTAEEVLSLAKQEGDKEDPPCCLKCLLNCLGRFLTKKRSRKGVIKKRGI